MPQVMGRVSVKKYNCQWAFEKPVDATEHGYKISAVYFQFIFRFYLSSYKCVIIYSI